MCVTCAIKLPRSRETGLPEKDAKWVLFKIRDRAYDPTYAFKTYNDGESTSLFLVDEDSDWTECIRVNNDSGDTELMFVNSALNNTLDKKDGKAKAKGGTGEVSDHGLVARRVSRNADLEEAVKAFTEMKFDGCTFISDGEETYLIESSLPADTKRKLDKKEGGRFREVANFEDFVTTTEKITDWIAVRTNHGITNEGAGYQESQGISYKSSSKRKEYAEKFIRENVFEVSDILHSIDAMGMPDIDSNAFLRPRRVKTEVEALAKKNPEVFPIFTTSAFVMTPSGHIKLRLYDASISKVNLAKIYSNDFPIKVSISR